MINDMAVDFEDADLLVKFIMVLLLEAKRWGMEKDLFLTRISLKDSNRGHVPIQILLWLLLKTDD
jgi:hypothetical protein